MTGYSLKSSDEGTGISTSATNLKMILASNIPVAVIDTQSGSPPEMVAAGLRTESAASCGCPVSIYQTWWAPQHSAFPAVSVHHQTPATAVSVRVRLPTNKHRHVLEFIPHSANILSTIWSFSHQLNSWNISLCLHSTGI